MINTSQGRGYMTPECTKVRNQTKAIWYLGEGLSSRGQSQGKIPSSVSFCNLPLRSWRGVLLTLERKKMAIWKHELFCSKSPVLPPKLTFLCPWLMLWPHPF